MIEVQIPWWLLLVMSVLTLWTISYLLASVLYWAARKLVVCINKK